MPDYSQQEFSLIQGGAVQYDFDHLFDDIKMTVYDNTNNNIVTSAQNTPSIYYIYESALFNDGVAWTSPVYYNPYDDNPEHTFGSPQRKPIGVVMEDTDPTSVQIYAHEILKTKYLSSGEYNLKFDFYKNLFNVPEFDDNNTDRVLYGANPRFIVKQVSPSRREIRLIIRNDEDDIEIKHINFEDIFYSGNITIHNFVLSLPLSRDIPINHYIVDDVSDTYTSLILKVNSPIPTDINLLSEVSINRKVINSYTQNILFVSNIIGEDFGNGLAIHTNYDYSPTAPAATSLQNYNDIIGSASISNASLDNVTYQISGSDPNLNINYAYFSDHTFFGSAKHKIQNFKTKIEDIENHFKIISGSLLASSSHMNELRHDRFKKIQKIKNSFTSYEKWLYDDNQTTATSSAPGIGKNLADHMPVSNSSFMSSLKNYDGFSEVFNFSNDNTLTNPAQKVEIFSKKYRADEGPFFNYSGSVYLSFMMKATPDITGSGDNKEPGGGLHFRNTNTNHTPKLPEEAHYSQSILIQVVLVYDLY